LRSDEGEWVRALRIQRALISISMTKRFDNAANTFCDHRLKPATSISFAATPINDQCIEINILDLDRGIQL
jgi:hypothetical protein